MALGLHSIVVLFLCATFATCLLAGDNDCKSYTDSNYMSHSFQQCSFGFCCGSCNNRACCYDPYRRLTEDQQENCDSLSTHSPYSSTPVVPVIVVSVIVFTVVFTLFCCCICPCCCLYSLCHKPRPVVATTHTTVVTSIPQQYPQQPAAVVGAPQPYQGAQYPPYQPMPVQPGYGSQAMPVSPYQGQQYPPLPTYQEATGPAYPPQPMPYSQAAYGPGQPAYPLQAPVQPQPNAPSSQMDFLSQPAFNPDYVAPPKTG